tara:strand:+ start:1543 stop:2355 length:813 start_codon:yes stop_codon:yes gene_type:complete
MKKEIRKILREHWEDPPDKWGLLEMDVRALTDKIIDQHKHNWGDDQYAVIDAIQQIFEGMFEKVPINETIQEFIGSKEKKTDSPDMIVGHQHYKGWGTVDSIGYTGEQLPMNIFFKIVETVANQLPIAKLEGATGDMEQMSMLIRPFLKLFGIGYNDIVFTASGLGVKIYHTIMDNYEGLTNGTITQGSELSIPPLKTFKVTVDQDETEQIVYSYTVIVDGYNEDDVHQEIDYDENGEFNWYDYEDSENFHKEVVESEFWDKRIDTITQL